MKFGKLLRRRSHAEWAEHYIDYKQLKQLINLSESPDRASLLELRDAFDLQIEEELGKVNAFFDLKIKALQQSYGELVALLQKAGHSQNQSEELRLPLLPALAKQALLRDISAWHGMMVLTNQIPDADSDENMKSEDSETVIREIGERLAKLIQGIDLLRSFVTLNHLGFVKIMKKSDKYLMTQTQDYKMKNIVRQQNFYKSPGFARLATMTDCLNLLFKMRNVPRAVIQTEFSCAVCLDFLHEPVVLTCAHRFCRGCLTHRHNDYTSCPICRREDVVAKTNIVDPALRHFLQTHFEEAVMARLEERNKEITAEVQAKASGGAGGGGHGRSEAAPHSTTVASDKLAKGLSQPSIEAASSSSAAAVPASSMDPATPVKERDDNTTKTKVGAIVASEVVQRWSHHKLRNINKLLEHAKKGNFFVLDIDETLLVPAGFPNMLLSPAGVRFASDSFLQNPQKVSSEQVLQCKRIYHQKLMTRVPVEDCTVEVVKKLQDLGCTVFGLTSRYSKTAVTTKEELLKVGIDLSRSSPFPNSHLLNDPVTKSACQDGVIFSNGQSKGPVLNRFLEGFVFHHLYREALQNGGFVASLQSRVPQKIVFVDDREQNCLSIHHALRSAVTFGIELTTFHYTRVAYNESESRPCASENSGAMTDEENPNDMLWLDPAVMRKQLQHLMETRKVIGDAEARELLQAA